MAVVVGLSAVFVGSALIIFAAFIESMLDERKRSKEKGPATFVYEDTDIPLMSVTGTYRAVGRWHLVVTDSAGFPTVIDRRDIVEVL